MSELWVEIVGGADPGRHLPAPHAAEAAPPVAFVPGDTLRGIARWSLDDALPSLEVRLIWFTKGKGTQDVKVVDRVTLDAPPRAGQRDFSFVLPDAPYSFSGKLISLIWAIEFVGKKAPAARQEFVLSPYGAEVDLTATGAPPASAFGSPADAAVDPADASADRADAAVDPADAAEARP